MSFSVGEASHASKSEPGLEQSIPTTFNSRHYAALLGRHRLHSTTAATATATDSAKRIILPH